MNMSEHDRDPDAQRPLTDAMTWGERQRLWKDVYKQERDAARQQLEESASKIDQLEQQLVEYSRTAYQRDQLAQEVAGLKVALERVRPPVHSEPGA